MQEFIIKHDRADRAEMEELKQQLETLKAVVGELAHRALHYIKFRAS